MVEVGDRVAVSSKAGARSGVVMGVRGALLQVLWDTGEETSFVPGVGVLTVIPHAPTRPTKSKSGSKPDAATKTGSATKRSKDTKKSGGKKASSTKTTAKKKR